MLVVIYRPLRVPSIPGNIYGSKIPFHSRKINGQKDNEEKTTFVAREPVLLHASTSTNCLGNVRPQLQAHIKLPKVRVGDKVGGLINPEKHKNSDIDNTPLYGIDRSGSRVKRALRRDKRRNSTNEKGRNRTNEKEGKSGCHHAGSKHQGEGAKKWQVCVQDEDGTEQTHNVARSMSDARLGGKGEEAGKGESHDLVRGGDECSPSPCSRALVGSDS